MKYVTGAWETFETAELLGELCYAEQLGYAGEVMAFEINEEIKIRFNEKEQAEKVEAEPVKVEAVEAVKEIDVFYEIGYKWSVWFNGESVDTGLTKREAMQIARKIKKENKNSVINEQKLTKKEKAENISWLHENSYNYTKF